MDEPINILIIDEDSDDVNSIIQTLRAYDYEGRLGEIYHDDCDVQDEDIEKYDLDEYKGCHIALIDFQLNKKFTGNLVSAWVMMNLKIPRMSLAGGKIPDDSDFDGHIPKREIYEEGTIKVIDRIVSCVNSFNYKSAVEKMYLKFVEMYSEYIDHENIETEEQYIQGVSSILDRLESMRDISIEKRIEDLMKIENIRKKYDEEITQLRKEMENLKKEINLGDGSD